MNWYKIAQPIMTLWHATIPQHARSIIKSGIIKPANQMQQETGENNAFWDFKKSTYDGEFDYGDAIYLEGIKEYAINFAEERLKYGFWEKIRNIDELSSEDMRFVAVFKINTRMPPDPKLQKTSTGSGNIEFVYFGEIGKDPHRNTWFEGPEWIDYSESAYSYCNNNIWYTNIEEMRDLEKILEKQYRRNLNYKMPLKNQEIRLEKMHFTENEINNGVETEIISKIQEFANKRNLTLITVPHL